MVDEIQGQLVNLQKLVKIKMWDSLLEKERESAVKGKKCFSHSSMMCISNCYCIFYLLYNAIIFKNEKLNN